MNEIITLAGLNDIGPASTADARAKRDQLLVQARKGTSINSPESAQKAGAILKELKAFTRLVEDDRKLVKEPVLLLGKRVDALANELTEAVEAEANRISRILAIYQAEQNRIAEQARREAWEKEEQIRREAAAKIAAAEATSRTPESAEKKVDRIEAQTTRAIVATRAEAAEAQAPKPAGIATQVDVKFEVKDVQALFGAFPHLVNLVPNMPLIRNHLKQNPNKPLPGVESWKEARSIVRG